MRFLILLLLMSCTTPVYGPGEVQDHTHPQDIEQCTDDPTLPWCPE